MLLTKLYFIKSCHLHFWLKNIKKLDTQWIKVMRFFFFFPRNVSYFIDDKLRLGRMTRFDKIIPLMTAFRVKFESPDTLLFFFLHY